MKEFPVFVPFGEDHLAAVIAVPDVEPRGLVALGTGVGAPRSHRFQMWAVGAEALAERGIASVRWDYRGFHDSTGTVTVVPFDETRVDQLRAVVSFAQRAVGAGLVATAGNCTGARMGLHLAAQDEDCVAVVDILPPSRPGNMHGMARRFSDRRLPSFLLKGAARRLLARGFRRVSQKPDVEAATLRRALEHARVLFLYGEEEVQTRAQAYASLQRVLASLPPRLRERTELRVLPGSLDRLASVQTQRALVQTVADWLAGCFAEATSLRMIATSSG